MLNLCTEYVFDVDASRNDRRLIDINEWKIFKIVKIELSSTWILFRNGISLMQKHNKKYATIAFTIKKNTRHNTARGRARKRAREIRKKRNNISQQIVTP